MTGRSYDPNPDLAAAFEEAFGIPLPPRPQYTPTHEPPWWWPAFDHDPDSGMDETAAERAYDEWIGGGAA